MKPYQLTYLAVALVFASACSEQEDEPQPAMGAKITFATTQDELTGDDGSRATPVLAPDFKEFKVYAYNFTNMASPELFMVDETAKQVSQTIWRTDKDYYWPVPYGQQSLRFLAYANYDENLVFTNPEVDNPADIRFTYKCPTDPKKQKDVIMTLSYNHTSTLNAAQHPVPLHFQHILAWVKFSFNGDAKRVKSVTLKNLISESVYVPAWGAWSEYLGPQTKADYTVEIPEDGVLTDDQSLMVIPHTTHTDGAVVVEMRDGSSYTVPLHYVTLQMDAVNNIRINLPAE